MDLDNSGSYRSLEIRREELPSGSDPGDGPVESQLITTVPNDMLADNGRGAMYGWVGLDIGTTSSKAVVYDDTGQSLGSSRRPTVWHQDADGTEIDANQLRDGDRSRQPLDRLSEGVYCAIAQLICINLGAVRVLMPDRGPPATA